MKLHLVLIVDHKAREASYIALNDRHLDATVAVDDPDIIISLLGDVFISDEVLQESGWRWKEDPT
jgi:hypothetical protein